MQIAHPHYQDYVLDTYLGWRGEGQRCALLTLIATTGGSPRPVGSQMAVCEDGRHVGMITGGCAESALVHDAIMAIDQGSDYIERYGEGSRFKDITLPCGAGLDIHFAVTLSDDEVRRIVDAHAARKPAQMVMGGFVRRYRPAGRIVIVGQGPIVIMLAQLAVMAEMETVIYSPDAMIEQALPDVRPLRGDGDFDADLLDANSALITLFHDHAFEPLILKAALNSPAFYIGALGSKRAHQARLKSLRGQGDVGRIHGPVGLDIGAKTPPEIALSIMAQIIEHWRKS
ncbi:XdhC family protein [Asticcacaulis endophyticus]|uniref:Lipoprotein n=1 Tax=Asticcacaulis endophyticus TaxID=1395890 RepID=A0A918PVC7_9CAUL|nr:XdhC family protein [Asticcacaulis endophyticus]GGZ24407.1 lipoprotein [Asticcacaulis endophyticus]